MMASRPAYASTSTRSRPSASVSGRHRPIVASGKNAVTGRRGSAASFALLVLSGGGARWLGAGGATAADDRQLAEAFERAARSGADFATADRLWTEAIEVSNERSASAWSNRGVRRLQENNFAAALSDLETAARLERQVSETGAASGYVLNAMGNCLGGLNRWDEAIAYYEKAAADQEDRDGVATIARANEALAYFQVANEAQAIRLVEGLLRRDSNWWDMRVALCAFLWAVGEESRAEEEWDRLCDSEKYVRTTVKAMQMLSFSGADGAVKGGGGAGPRRSTRGGGAVSPCSLYTSTDIVKNRWPPRPTAAFQAFLVGIHFTFSQEIHTHTHTHTHTMNNSFRLRHAD